MRCLQGNYKGEDADFDLAMPSEDWGGLEWLLMFFSAPLMEVK